MSIEAMGGSERSGAYLAAMILAAALLATAPGCPDPPPGDDDTSDADDDTTEGDDDSTDGGLLGQVRIHHWQVDSEFGDAQPVVWMWGIYDGPFPGEAMGVIALESWEVVAEAGDCVYIDRVDPGLCDPPCPGGSICTSEGACEPLPALQPAGTLTLTGLTTELSLVPDDLGYYHLEGTPGFPLFTADTTVELGADGGATPAFGVTAGGVDDLQTAVPCDLELTEGEPLELEWIPAGDGARVRWEMFSFMHAGNGPVLRCVTDDDGGLTVAAELVERYLLDRTAFETYELSRFRRAQAALEGGGSVGLEVASVRTCFHLPQGGGSGGAARGTMGAR